MDIELAIISACYTKITACAELITLFGEQPHVFLNYPDEASQPYPFIVHRFDWAAPDDAVTRHGYYALTIWDQGDTATRLYAARAEIVNLFDERSVAIVDVVTARFWLDNPTGFVPDPEPNIWHYEMRFYVRTTRQTEILRQLA